MATQIENATITNMATMKLMHEEVGQLLQGVADRVMQVAKNAMVQKVATRGYELYSLLCTYPKKPLWALYTPFVAATNFFLPQTLRQATKSLPTWLKSFFVFKVTKKQLFSEAAMATLFISAMKLIPEEYKVPCSLILMGVLPYVVRGLQERKCCKKLLGPMLV